MHWYDSEGNPCYTIIGVNGKERNTHKGDARKLNLVPSVTEITKVKAAGFYLEKYKRDQLLSAAWDESESVWDLCYNDWSSLCIAKAGEHSKNAREKGSLIHDELEYRMKKRLGVYNGKQKRRKSKYDDICDAVFDWIDDTYPGANWVAEASFANMEYGYGGKCDLHDPDNNIILDYKTKDKPTVEGISSYEDQWMQLSAYARGLLDLEDTRYLVETCLNAPDKFITEKFEYPPILVNMFISTQTYGDIQTVDCSDKFDRYWEMFYHLLKVWQIEHGFGDYK